MNELKIKPDESIDFDNPSTIIKEFIVSYYEEIHNHFGEFCADCQHLSEQDGCLKELRPRKYRLEIGPHDYVIARKNCKSFEIFHQNEADEDIAKKISLALDCNYQQYC